MAVDTFKKWLKAFKGEDEQDWSKPDRASKAWLWHAIRRDTMNTVSQRTPNTRNQKLTTMEVLRQK